MKRADLVRKIELSGAKPLRNGARHDWYQNLKTGVCQPVPRHREINEFLARHIIRKLQS